MCGESRKFFDFEPWVWAIVFFVDTFQSKAAAPLNQMEAIVVDRASN